MLPLLTLPETGRTGLGKSPVLGADAPRLRPRVSVEGISDPAEPWETPVPWQDRHKVNRMLPGRPFRPTKPAEVPEAAMATLAGLCGSLALEQLYVIPRTVRLVDRVHCVMTPAKVIAFGQTRVGLWVDNSREGRASSIAIEDLLAVDDRTILLYGRLRLIARDGQIVVRYNTVSRSDVQQNLGQVRARMAGRAEPVEPGFLWLDPADETKGRAELPHKWRVVLDNPAVRPDLDEPVTIAAGNVSEIKPGHTRPASGVSVLSGRELVIVTEPIEYLDRARYGVDLLAVPRERLVGLHWDGQALTVNVARLESGEDAHTSVTLPIDSCLVEAMWRSFGSAVRWT